MDLEIAENVKRYYIKWNVKATDKDDKHEVMEVSPLRTRMFFAVLINRMQLPYFSLFLFLSLAKTLK